MDINTIITLDDKTKYVILDKLTKNKIKYYFAIKLDEKENPTLDYEIFELEKKDADTYMNLIEDNYLRESLFIDFSNNYINKQNV